MLIILTKQVIFINLNFDKKLLIPFKKFNKKGKIISICTNQNQI